MRALPLCCAAASMLRTVSFSATPTPGLPRTTLTRLPTILKEASLAGMPICAVMKRKYPSIVGEAKVALSLGESPGTKAR